jgi:hypothetical protein
VCDFVIAPKTPTYAEREPLRASRKGLDISCLYPRTPPASGGFREARGGTVRSQPNEGPIAPLSPNSAATAVT